MSIFEEISFKPKVVIFDQVSWSKNQQKNIQCYFFLSSIIRRVKQAQIFNFCTSTLEKISKILKNFDFFAFFFDLRGRGWCSKFCKIVEQISVSNKCPHLLRLHSQFLRLKFSQSWSYPFTVHNFLTGWMPLDVGCQTQEKNQKMCSFGKLRQ
jgi:hypothetical protein